MKKKCNCCYCKAQKEEQKAQQKAQQKAKECLTKGCKGFYGRTIKHDRSGLPIYVCNICGSEAV